MELQTQPNQPEMLKESYVSTFNPESIKDSVVADRPCNPLKSYALEALLSDLFNSIDGGKGAHLLLKDNVFKEAMKRLILISIVQQREQDDNGEYKAYLVDDINVRIPSQVQWILSRCTTHVDENYTGNYILDKEAQKIYDSWNIAEECKDIVKVFKALYKLQAKEKVPFRLAETIPYARRIVADGSFICWIEKSSTSTNTSKDNIMIPYPKVNPLLTAQAALLHAGTVKELDSTAYSLRSDTVGSLAKALS